MEALRDAVLYPELAEHGTNQFGKDKGDNNVMSSQGNSETYTIARLKRDQPTMSVKMTM
jgi:hypothetical protein